MPRPLSSAEHIFRSNRGLTEGEKKKGKHGEQRYLFSRSGMVRFLLMKHIFRLMTFLSLGDGEPPCLGEPESSLPL